MSAVRKTASAYVDGLNLYHGLMSEDWGSSYRWLDPWRLALQAVYEMKNRYGVQWNLTHVHYFTSLVLESEKQRKQDEYIQAIQEHREGQVSVSFGKYQRWQIKCGNCGTKSLCQSCNQALVRIQEKQLDVAIAVAMLKQCYEVQNHNVILISGDSDLKPAVETVRKDLGREVLIAAPPGRAYGSEADYKFILRKHHFGQSALPKAVTVTGPGGKTEITITRHPGW